MKQSKVLGMYEGACALLPERLSIPALELDAECMGRVEELRLRVGRTVQLTLPDGEIPLPLTRVTGEDLECILDRASEFSRYAAEESMRRGFLTARGGYRVGICGCVRYRNGDSAGFQDVSSLNIRIPHEVEEIARPLLPCLLENEKPVSTLIMSPPGGGKTTLLRDLVRLVSDGSELSEPMRVSLVDERGEIAAMYRGVPQLAVGYHTDVMDSCPKDHAIPMFLRAMTPQVIALDEIALASDVDALCAASNCGVVLIATVHAGSVEELAERPVLNRLLMCGVFRRAVMIRVQGGKRIYRTEVLA